MVAKITTPIKDISMQNIHSDSNKVSPKKNTLSKRLGVFLFLTGIAGLYFTYDTVGKSDFKLHIGIVFTLLFLGIMSYMFHSNDPEFNKVNSWKTSNKIQKTGLVIASFSLLIVLLALVGISLQPSWLFLTIALVGMAIGILVFTYGSYAHVPKGIKNNNVYFNGLTNRSILGWLLGILLTTFYIQLYWFSASLETLIELFNPLSEILRNSKADKWFVYGTLYTFVILFLGIKFIYKYRHSRYQVIRTLSVVVAQFVFAYYLPMILESFNSETGYFSRDLKNVWPLNYAFFSSSQLDAMQQTQQFGPSGQFYFIWGLFLFLVLTPILTYYVGKRWYCSWICGCGGLAETAGDSFRQLSSKKVSSWKIERWVIHSVMVFVLIMSVAAMFPYFSGKEYVLSFASINQANYLLGMVILLGGFSNALIYIYVKSKEKKKVLLAGAAISLTIVALLLIAKFTNSEDVFSLKSRSIKKAYGFFIGAIFSGVIGVGFYPMLGNRVWCRFGCPMAGYMGLFQRFKSRFRITTNGSQCISCGNCSTYCEQGIDVRAYAQKGQNIVRSSCVGCGICSEVCPRGVLKLENGPEKDRIIDNPIHIGKDGVYLNL
jgi:polyferredoxin